MEKDRGGDKEQYTNNEKSDTEKKPSFKVFQDGNVERKVESKNLPVYFHPSTKKKERKKRFMPIFLTISSASLIGVIFGVIMLQMFVTLDEPSGSENSTLQAGVTANNVEKAGSEFPELSGYMLQAGVFKERENAEEWMNFYQSENVAVMIWERDGQYYLFTGIYGTEENAKQKAIELQTEGFDIFVKPWSTSTVELTVTDAEADWINEFRETWSQSVVEKNMETLQNLLSSPPESDLLNRFITALEMDGAVGDELLYLNLMYAYEQLDKDM